MASAFEVQRQERLIAAINRLAKAIEQLVETQKK
jgi:hypothetical protein